MRITDIEISPAGYSPRQARQQAHVCLTLADRVVTLFCTVALGADSGAEARRAAFLGEALRQLARMPEFRAGYATLEIAEDIAGGLSGGLTGGLTGRAPHPAFA